MKPNIYVYILVMAGVTYLIRMLPLVLFKKEITSPFVKSFLYYVPYACLAAMTFPAILTATAGGILSGVVLATGRIVGETAALIYTAGSVAKVPSNLMGSGRTLAVHMYVLSSEGLYMDQAYATAVILLIFVLVLNWVSGFCAKHLSKATNGQ